MISPPLRSILLVEDDPDIRTIAKLALEEVGRFSVTAFEGGGEAVRAFPELRPDLILLDVTMPDMDGPATLEALRRLSPASRTPVVFLTANTQTMDVTRYLRLGAADVIRKPFDPMVLPAVVQKIWERVHGRT